VQREVRFCHAGYVDLLVATKSTPHSAPESTSENPCERPESDPTTPQNAVSTRHPATISDLRRPLDRPFVIGLVGVGPHHTSGLDRLTIDVAVTAEAHEKPRVAD
jgi:hypothetical protein